MLSSVSHNVTQHLTYPQLQTHQSRFSSHFLLPLTDYSSFSERLLPGPQVCTGEGPEECRTVYESSCSTKYVKSAESEDKFLADTACEKLPVKICGAGCNYVDGEEECHDKVITTIVNVPEARPNILLDERDFYSLHWG